MFEFCQRHCRLLYIPGKECSLGSGNCALYKCGIEMYPMTGVIIRCKRFGPHGKSAYKKLAIIKLAIIIVHTFASFIAFEMTNGKPEML